LDDLGDGDPAYARIALHIPDERERVAGAASDPQHMPEDQALDLATMTRMLLEVANKCKEFKVLLNTTEREGT